MYFFLQNAETVNKLQALSLSTKRLWFDDDIMALYQIVFD